MGIYIGANLPAPAPIPTPRPALLDEQEPPRPMMGTFGGLGGLGGLGGVPQPAPTNDFASMLRALGGSLMSSPRSAPLANYAQLRAGYDQQAAERQKAAQEEQRRQQSLNATWQFLLSKGYSEEEASAAISNPDVLNALLRRMQGSERQPLMNAGGGYIYDPNNGEWITPPGQGGGDGEGGFRFSGNSVEAQALNGLMDSGALTPAQAQQLAAGKTITGPNGEIIFMTPEGVFSRPAEADSVSPGGGGNIQVTGPKAPDVDERKAGGFADRLSNSGAIIDSLESAGTNWKDWGMSNVPLLGNVLVSEDFQKLDQAKRDFVNAILRRESGAVISDEEFDNANKQYFPQPGDTKETIAQKARNRRLVIESMARDAGPTYRPRSSGGYKILHVE